jgi:hypothetical protein
MVRRWTKCSFVYVVNMPAKAGIFALGLFKSGYICVGTFLNINQTS